MAGRGASIEVCAIRQAGQAVVRLAPLDRLGTGTTGEMGPDTVPFDSAQGRPQFRKVACPLFIPLILRFRSGRVYGGVGEPL